MRRLAALLLLLASCARDTSSLEPGTQADAAVATPDAAATTPDASSAKPDAAGLADGGISDSGAGGPVCSADGWCWALRTPQGLTLNDVWGTGPNNVLAVGAAGVILRFDGTFWSAQPSSTTADLFALWGSGPDDVWAVGDQAIVHFDGTAWSTAAGATAGRMRAVWGSAPNDVWAIGDGGLAKWNGSAWSATEPIVVGASTFHGLRDVWGTSATDVWIIAGGDASNTALLHWDGVTWSRAGGWDSHTEPVPTALFGTRGDDVIAIGRTGSRGNTAALRWNGVAWTPEVVSTAGAAFAGLWASAPSDTWAVGRTPSNRAGDRAVLQRWDGATWSPYTVDAAALTSVWGSGPDDVFAVGEAGTIVHFDGVTWTPISRGFPDGGREASVHAMWPAGPDDVWIAGTEGVLHSDDASMQRSLSSIDFFEALWGSGPDDVWAVGRTRFPYEQGLAKRWNGTAWIDVPLPPSMESHALFAVWGSSPTDVFAVGSIERVGDDRPFVVRSNGSTWSPMSIQDLPPARHSRLYGVWGSGPNDVWAVGARGDFSMSSAVVTHWDGAAWTGVDLMLSPGDTRIEAIWGSGPNDVWAVGARGESAALVLHWDGARWIERDAAGMPALTAITGRGPTEIAATGRDGTVWRWNGAAWTSSDTGIRGAAFEAIAFTDRALWAAGFRYREGGPGGDWVVVRSAWPR